MNNQKRKRGVTYNKQRGKWIFRKTVDGKRVQVASVKTLLEANTVANNEGNGGMNTNTLHASHGKDRGHLSLCRSGLNDCGDQEKEVSIGRNEAPVPKRSWSSLKQLNEWLGKQPATFWIAPNGDRATLISQAGRVVQVEYLTASRGTIHFEVSRLKGSEYDFRSSSPATHCYRTKREATKTFNRISSSQVAA